MRTEAAILRAAHEWIVGPHTGLSSITIWAVMLDVVCANPSLPCDDDDMWRCVRLLDLIPEWRVRLDEVGATCPRWSPWPIERLKGEAYCRRLRDSRDADGRPIRGKA